MLVVGQDPYPSKRHATGYAFDVPEGKTRMSFTAIQNAAKDYGINLDSLDPIKNDVMLLNANLTTICGTTKAHDWRWFTKEVVEYVSKINRSCQFVFLGKYAQTINTVEGLNLYHPAANARSGKKLFNKTFFELTEKSVKWKEIYEKSE